MHKNSITISKVIESDPFVCAEVISYLSSRELKAILLLSNFFSRLQPSTVYAAKRGNTLVGVGGYYETYHSCSICSDEAEASQKLVSTILHHHPSAQTILGMSDVLMPIYERLLSESHLRVKSTMAPFFIRTLDDFVPFSTDNVRVRPMTPQDVDQVTQLRRLLHNQGTESSITDEERKQIVPLTFCCEVDNHVVAIASSTGLAVSTFLIVGVATEPKYRGRGYAKAVCSALINSMRDRGARQAVLFTWEDNLPALACYRSLGFRKIDTYCVITLNA